MDFIPHFFRPKTTAAEKGRGREEVEEPAPIAEGPAPDFSGVGPSAAAPRWRLGRETLAGPRTHPLAGVSEIPSGEVTLTLEEVLPRVPTHALKPGLHDPDLLLRFRANDLLGSLSRGRPAISLSLLAERYPEIFEVPAGMEEDAEVLLPLPKILSQFGKARSVPLPPSPFFPPASTLPEPMRRPLRTPPAPLPPPPPVQHSLTSFAPATAPAPPPVSIPLPPVMEEPAVPLVPETPVTSAAPPPQEESPAPAPMPEVPPAVEATAASEPPTPSPLFVSQDETPVSTPAAPPMMRIFPGPPALRPPVLRHPLGDDPVPDSTADSAPPVVIPPPAFIHTTPEQEPAPTPQPEAAAPSAPEPPPIPEAIDAPEVHPAAVPEPVEAEAEPSPITPVPVVAPEPAAAVFEKQMEFFIEEQEPLQAIFMTDEELSLSRISELSASLPGLLGCMILAGEHFTQGGERPAGLDAATLRELSRQLTTTIEGFHEKLPAEPNFTLYGGNRALSLFARAGLCLCVVHSPRGFLPGVRERLAAVADSLARGLPAPSPETASAA